MSIKSRIRDWTSIIESYGSSVVEISTSTHIKFKLQGGEVFVVAMTASDWRSDINARQTLKRLLGVERALKKSPVERKKPPCQAKTPARPKTPPAPAPREPQSTLNPHHRARLGLDRPPIQTRIPDKPTRPILTLPAFRREPAEAS